jgi:S1-C subfamily serine protease
MTTNGSIGIRNISLCARAFLSAALVFAYATGACNKGPDAERLDRDSLLYTMYVQNHFIQLYEKYMPATVTIVTDGGAGKRSPIGTGFFINREGYILTCRHVVAGRRSCAVMQGKTGKVLTAAVFNEDAGHDIALLKADFGDKKPVDLPFIPLTPDAQAKTGSLYMAIGAPGGMKETMLAGIVSRNLRLNADPAMPGRAYVQLGGQVAPGSSGGPVLDMSGSVIGMMRFTLNTGGALDSGTGFAIPANDLYRFALNQKDIRGMKEHDLRGIEEIPFTTPYLAGKLGLPDPYGALVSSVGPGSPADRAGIMRYDFIISVEQKQVTSAAEMTNAFSELKYKKDITVTLFRKGETMKKTISGFMPAVR